MKRLLLIALLLMAFSGCAKLPAEKLESARGGVARAYAGGAANYAPGEYQLASSALAAAEKQIALGEYDQAEKTLDLSNRYSEAALRLSKAQLKRVDDERVQLEEQLRLAELERQRELEVSQQAELQKQREDQQRRLDVAKRVAAEKAAVSEAVVKEVEAVLTPEPVDTVEVGVGEDLAMVAARVEVYDDADLWPLIYKANRDQIKNPREVFSGQILVVPRDKSREELEAARMDAAEFGDF